MEDTDDAKTILAQRKTAFLYSFQYCENKNKGFNSLVEGERNPVTIAKDIKETAYCAYEFLQAVRQHCKEQFIPYHRCVENSGKTMDFHKCNEEQKVFSQCVFEKIGTGDSAIDSAIYKTDQPETPNFSQIDKTVSDVLSELLK